MVEKSQMNKIFCDKWELYEIQIKFYWDTDIIFCVQIATAAFMLQRQNWVIVTEPKNCKIFTIWLFIEKNEPILKSETMEHPLKTHEIKSIFKNVTHGSVTMENSIEVPQKVKKRTTIGSSNSTSGYISKENEITVLKRYLHPPALCLLWH